MVLNFKYSHKNFNQYKIYANTPDILTKIQSVLMHIKKYKKRIHPNPVEDQKSGISGFEPLIM